MNTNSNNVQVHNVIVNQDEEIDYKDYKEDDQNDEEISESEDSQEEDSEEEDEEDSKESSAPVHVVHVEQKDDSPTQEELDEMTRQIAHLNPCRGDLVSNEKTDSYRNTGLYIYDGTSVIPLEDDCDEYGHLPREFEIWTKHEKGFLIPAEYWNLSSDRSITHNSIVWFDHTKYKKQILKNITYGLLPFYPCSKYAIYTWFEIEGKKYRIIYNYQSKEDGSYEEEDSETLALTEQDQKCLMRDFKKYLGLSQICFWCTSWADEYMCMDSTPTIHLWNCYN